MERRRPARLLPKTAVSIPWASGAVRPGRPEPAELAIAALLASALWLPPIAGGKAWPVALGLLLGLAAVHAVRRRGVRFPGSLAALLAALALAAIHAGTLTGSYTSAYIIRPLEAVAVATLIVSAAQRRRILFLIVLFAATQIPIAAAQAIDNVLDYGREATIAADSVTGSLGVSQAGILTLVALAAATILLGGWQAGALKTRHMLPLVLALLSTGVFSATRAVIPFTVGLAVAIACGALLLGSRRPAVSRSIGLVAASVVVAPLLYVAMDAIYPGVFAGAVSSQSVDVLGGSAAQGIPTEATPTPPPAAEPTSSLPPLVAPPPTPPSGVELLPGRFLQVRLAVELSVQDGLTTALLGRGPGAAELDPSHRWAQDVPLPQRTGTTLIGVLLTEAGWLAVSAFAGLLAWLTWAGRCVWIGSQRISDRALGAALPGIAALTAAGAFFVDILDARGYSIVLWLVVGLAISAAHDRSHPFVA